MSARAQENDSGELELDMEQLSVGAIQKLWEVCSKTMPGFGRGEGGGGGGSPPVEDSSPPAERGAPKNRKKNKPMNAREQEERIANLKRIQEQFRNSRAHSGQAGSPGADESINAAMTPTGGHDESSEESDSEEE